MKKYDVVTIGDIFEDIFVFPETAKISNLTQSKLSKSLCFGYGDKIDIENISRQVGGSAANAAANFAKIGLTTGIISSLGTDSSSEKIYEKISQSGIDLSHIKKNNSENNNLSIILSYGGDRTILTYHGCKDCLSFTPNKSLKTNWFYLAPLKDNCEVVENRIIEIIARDGCGLFWNPGGDQIEKGVRNYKHLLRFCNTIFLNREEALEFTKTSSNKNIKDLLKIFFDFGVKIVVITDGKAGSTCYDGKLFYKIGPTSDERVDATGAGDSFASTFAANIIINFDNGKSQGYIPEKSVIEKSLKMAAIVSGSVVTKIGAQPGLLTLEEIKKIEEKMVKFEVEIFS